MQEAINNMLGGGELLLTIQCIQLLPVTQRQANLEFIPSNANVLHMLCPVLI